MKRLIVALILLSCLSAVGLGLAQNSHLTPISTSSFIYNDGPTIIQSPAFTPKPVFGAPPVWSTPLTQPASTPATHQRTKKRRKALPTATPNEDRSGKVTNNSVKPLRLPSQ